MAPRAMNAGALAREEMAPMQDGAYKACSRCGEEKPLTERRLAEECDRYGLPHNLNMLLRHIYANHNATIGALRDSNATLRARLDGGDQGAVDMLERIATDLEHELSVGGQMPTVFPDEIRALLRRLGRK